VLLESLLDLDGFRRPPTVEALAAQALEVFRRRRGFIADIQKDLRQVDAVDERKWLTYWKGNPINAWTGGNRKGDTKRWFEVADGRFRPTFAVDDGERVTFQAMVQALVDYRLAAYEPRLPTAPADDAASRAAATAATAEDRGERPPTGARILPFRQPATAEASEAAEGTEVPYFPDLRIACGHFRTGRTDVEKTCHVPPVHGSVDPSRHFVARATGNSMNGGKHPVRDDDALLLELVDPTKAGSITGSVMAIERQDATGDDQYVLRRVTKLPDGRYVLKAANPDYPDFEANEDMRPLARLVASWSEEG
jgi:SOS-response transcriptional repressor LexA